MVREGFAGAFGLLGAGDGRTGSGIRSWTAAGGKAYQRSAPADQPASYFSESGHAAASSSRGTDPGEERDRRGDETSARGAGGKVSARSHRLLSLRAAQGASSRATAGLDCKSRQNIVSEGEFFPR